MNKTSVLWFVFLGLWSLSLLFYGAVGVWQLPVLTAAMGALYVAASILLPERLKLSKPAVVFLLSLAALFLVQLLPLGPILFPYTAQLRTLHGSSQLWPATADLYYTVRQLAQVAAYVLAGLFILRLRQNGLTGSQMLTGLIAVLAAEAAYGLVQAFAGFKDVPFFGPRPGPDSASGTLVNRNNFGGLMAMGLVLAVARAYGRIAWPVRKSEDLGKPRWMRRLESGAPWALAGALFAVAIILSKSRGATLAAVGGIFLLPFFHRGRASAAGAAALVSLGAVAVFIANPAGLIERFGQIDPFEISMDSRMALFKTTAEAAVHQPVLGFGWGTHPRAYHPFQPPSIQGQVQHAHNEYVNVFFEAGIVGLAMLVAGLGVWYVRVWRGQRALSGPDRIPVAAALAAVSAVAIHAFVDFDLRITSIGMLFGALIALGGSAARDGVARRTWPAAAVAIASAAALLLPLDPGLPQGEAAARRALAISPYDYRSAWMLARATGDPARFEIASDLWPAHPGVQQEAGLTFWENAMPARAARCLRRLFESNPYAVAGVMDEIWETARGRNEYEELLPELPGPWSAFAVFLVRKGRWGESKEVFERGCPKRAENASWFDYYAANLEQAGQWGLEAMVRDARLEVKSDPSAHAAAARAWLKLGAHDEALKRIAIACRIDPATAAWPALKADILEAKGDRLGAMEAYAEAARLAPSDLDHKRRRGLAALADKAWVSAADDLREVLRSRPQDRGATLGLARALAGQGNASSARILLDEWLRKNPDDGEAKSLRDSLTR